MNLNNLISDFLEYLEVERNVSKLTIRNYRHYLTRFVNWLKESSPTLPDHENINVKTLTRFRLFLSRYADAKGLTLKRITQNYHLIAIRSFLKYLAKRDISSLAPEKVELARLQMRHVGFLEGSDLYNLLDAPLKSKNPKIIQFRDKAILELFFSTGMRVSELASLKKDLNIKKTEFSIRGKGGKIRVAFLSNQARYWIQEYRKLRKDKNLFLFIGHDKAAEARNNSTAEEKDFIGLTPRSLERIVKKYAQLVGINQSVTPHTMRHSFATDLLMNGADIRSVQSILGHSSITTTQIYTHITNQQLRDVHKAFHNKRKPLSKKNK